MKKINFFLTILVLFILSFTVLNAQTRIGNSFSVLAPSADFSEVYVVGVSFNGDAEFPLNDSFFATLETGYQSWQAEDLPNGETAEEENTFLVGAGVKKFFGSFFLGADADYFLGDFDEFTVKANAGFRFGKINIETQLSVLDPVTFVGIELGYFWYQKD